MFIGFSAFSQPGNDAKLANHYFQKAEYDKAEPYYEKLYKDHGTKVYFEKYYYCLFYQQKFDECEKKLEKQIRKFPDDVDYQFMLAQVYEETDRPEEAEKIFITIIEELPAVKSKIDYIGKQFKLLGKYDYALQTYLKGKDMLRGGYGFQIELAELYSILNEPELMIEEYLNLLEYSPVYLRTVQTYMSRIIDFEEDIALVQMLKEKLLLRIQKYPNDDHYSEMLIWFYLHKGEFTGAVIQAKAFDKRKKLRGKRVFEIGEICMQNEAYGPAKSAFDYVIAMEFESPYYEQSMERKLIILFIEVTQKGNYSLTEVEGVAAEFEKSLTVLGKKRETLGIIMQLSRIYAFYLDQPEKAESLLVAALDLPLRSTERAQVKVLLGDVYIVSGQIWDASILYMQVAKDFPEDPIGHEAKFKNAKVFYYDGEFEYAKAQLDVLKASTTKLIANDAMQLSLLLQDNLGIDTTRAPVQMFANADLLIQQHKYPEALSLLDSIRIKYPFHDIVDEVYFKKAEIYEQMQDWNKALELYGIVESDYGFDILADDACYRMAKIYENRLNNPGKAAEYYKKILFDHKGSLYTEEARKRYQMNMSAQEKFNNNISN